MSDPWGKTSKELEGESPVVSARNPMEDLLIGLELLDHYKIIRLIGTGGWGNVYLGQHLLLGSDVAIKVIHKHLLQDKGSLKRLEQEAKVLSKLESPHIIRVLDYGLTPFAFIIMEYFDGMSLADWLKEKVRSSGTLPLNCSCRSATA